MAELFGRGVELHRIERFLDGVRRSGNTRLVRGEPGVGKSALLDAAADLARAADMLVLRASGSEFEADVGYSGLNQLLLSLRDDLDRLPPGPRDALAVALGFGPGPPPGALLVCNAALSLLIAVAERKPLLLLIDDVQWIDRASAMVFGFIARRVAGHPIGLVMSCRAGSDCLLDRRGLTEQVVEPLDREASERLVDDQFPHLPPGVRQRVLDLAQGNPLALVELPGPLTGPAPLVDQPEVVPLSDRLQALFTSRIAALPDATRRLLLAAAFDGSGDVRLLRQAGGERPGLADLAPAERAQLVHVDDGAARITFRHPLIRATIVAMSTHEERRHAHLALAGSLHGDQERQAWHLAAAAVGPDDATAGVLDRVARRTMLRGDVLGAVSALVRAAELSTTPQARGRRLAEAAYIGAESGGTLGDPEALLAEAHRVGPDSIGALHAANAATFLMLNGGGDVDTAHRLLVGAIEAADHGHRADDTALIEAMHTLLLLSWYAGTPAHWESFFRVLRTLTPEPPEILALASRTFADPLRSGAAAAPELERLLATLPGESDSSRIVRIGAASVFLDRLADTREAHWRVVRHGRSGGSPRRHIGALMHLCLDDYLTGRWDEAEELAHEGQELCTATGFTFFTWYFLYNRALIAAGRGRDDEAFALADEMSHWARPRAATSVLLYAHHPRALAAAATGDFEAAFRHAAALSPPGVLTFHVPQCTWVMFDLVEAALRTGRGADARAHLEVMRETDVAALSPRMELIQRGVEALVLDHEAADARLEESLASPASDRWLFEACRIRLSYAEGLRRRKDSHRAQRHLIAARDGFAALGAKPWLARARQELRAGGFRSSREPSESTLTSQELQIAHLAASGMTNRQIGERLYLSHRTVGAHLYRVFPKLGVSSRAGLRDALSADPGLHGPVSRTRPRTR
ncbi:AAA family ATPase [Mycolicibacterium fluoranthenivorans]|nr:LuxR family transcriptional regulator [Mycolicibacterium fluoranthenivorans]